MSLRSFRRRAALPAASTPLLVAVLCVAPLLGSCTSSGPSMPAEPPDLQQATTDSPAEMDGPPSADEIFARYVEAIGGEDAIRAHSSATTKGTFEVPTMGLSGALTIYQIAPDKGVVHTSIPGMGDSIQGYNGEIGWSEDAMQGPRLLEGAELTAVKMQIGLHAALEYSEHYPERTAAGEAEWNDQAAYRIDLVDVDGNESSQYFATETGLLLGTEGSTTTDMGTFEATTNLSDYQEFGGVLFATSAITNMPAMGVEFAMTFESVTFDDVDPASLEPSEAIKALLPE